MKHKLPKGFKASGIHCGLKKKRKDLALIVSDRLCSAAALFTTNAVKAAPVVLGIEQMKKNRGRVKAVVVNSGNANCMTGERGMQDARKMVSSMAALLGAGEDTVIVSSTGIIGEFMDMKPVLGGMDKLVRELSEDGLQDAAEGIVTTDRFVKIASREFELKGKSITITGIAKGAGMIHPNMATTLCYIMTDARMSAKAVKKALKFSADTSFNAITVDGDMSTNDTMILMANGAAGNPVIKDNSEEFSVFKGRLEAVAMDLARMIVMDGEGANRFIEVSVTGAKTLKDARMAAKSIAGSLLVKCAVLGGDPNWGRIASSVGASGAVFDPGKLVIRLDGVTFFSGGRAVKHVDRKKSKVFKGKSVRIEAELSAGSHEARVYSCDISKKYITLNSFYTT